MATDTIPLAILVERRALDNPWQDCQWRALAVLTDPPPEAGKGWTWLRSEGPHQHYLAGVLPLHLWPDDVGSYRFNLESATPSLYVVLRPDDSAPEHPYRLVMISAAPDEVQPLMESGSDLIDAVPMPPSLQAQLAAFITAHPVEQNFVKRQRKSWAPEAGGRLRDSPSQHTKTQGPRHEPAR